VSSRGVRKLAAKAVPGVGQALAVVEGTPAAGRAAGRAWDQAKETVKLGRGLSKRKGLRGKASGIFETAKSGLKVQWEVAKGGLEVAEAVLNSGPFPSQVSVWGFPQVICVSPDHQRWSWSRVLPDGSSGRISRVLKHPPDNGLSDMEDVLSVHYITPERRQIDAKVFDWRGGLGHHGYVPPDQELLSMAVTKLNELANRARRNPTRGNPRRGARRNPHPADLPLPVSVRPRRLPCPKQLLYVNVLAHLRALQWVAWTAHWTAAGPNYYGDHKLLQRLYGGSGGGPNINDEIDRLGERMVAYFGSKSVSPTLINSQAQQIIESVRSFSTPLRALSVLEDHLQLAIRTAWNAEQAARKSSGNDNYSLGLDNTLMQLADERDTARYLLGQRLAVEAKSNGPSSRAGRRVWGYWGQTARAGGAYGNPDLPPDAEVLEARTMEVEPGNWGGYIRFRVPGQGGYDRAPYDEFTRLGFKTKRDADEWVKKKLLHRAQGNPRRRARKNQGEQHWAIFRLRSGRWVIDDDVNGFPAIFPSLEAANAYAVKWGYDTGNIRPVTAQRTARKNSTKGAYPFAMKEELYRTYTNDQLHWALKDAKEARENMRGHDTLAEAWYADDVHTILAELRRRGALQ